jgi:hypothetical protein
MTTYTLAKNGGVVTDSGSYVPPDPRNADWQAYQAWLGAGNTPQPVPAPSAAETAQATYAAALAVGLVTTWSTSTGLNGIYALDQTTQFNMTAETVSILTNGSFTNGATTRNWPNAAGAFQSFTLAQFKALASAIALYLDGLASALATASAGGAAGWPNATVTISA